MVTSSRAADARAIAALVVIGAAAYWRVTAIPPFEADNLYALGWVDASSPWQIVRGDAVIYPEWRPLAYLSLWAEHRLVGLAVPGVHLLVNLALWVTCAGLVYHIVRRFNGAAIAAFGAAMFVLTDPRATSTLVNIIDRQSSMACGFGLCAIVLVLNTRAIGAGRALGVFGLALASALSKEYGLAFAMAIALSGVVRRRLDLAVPALLAFAAYIAVRFAVAGGASQVYCQGMYFFAHSAEVCIDPLRPSSFAQMGYNAAITLVNLPLLGLFTPVGQPVLAESRLATGLVLTLLAAMGAWKGSDDVRMIAIVPVANALLSVMLYHERNQLPGACALAILAGVGAAPALSLLAWPAARRGAALAIAALLASQTVLAHALVNEHQLKVAALEPCDSEARDRAFVPPVIARLKTYYARPDPSCRGSR